MNDEPTLAPTWDELRQETGAFLGHGSVIADWDTDTATLIGRVVNSGYARTLTPPPIPDPVTGAPGRVHIWSWLRPVTNLQVVSGIDTYDLPASYAGIEDRITFNPSQNQLREVMLVSEAQIRQLKQNTTNQTGPPLYAAARFKTPNTATAPRSEIVFFPTPDGDYDMEFRMVVNMHKLSDENPRPVVPPECRELLIEACLAVAEERREDQPGMHNELFMRQLSANIGRDQMTTRPQTLGIMGDPGGLDREALSRIGTVSYVGGS